MDEPIAMQLDFHVETFLLVYIAAAAGILVFYKVRAHHKYRIWYPLLFALYILFLIKFVIFPLIIFFEGGEESMYYLSNPYTQLIPFHFLSEYRAGYLGTKQIVGNIVLLVPLVFFIRFILESRTAAAIRRKTFFFCVGISAAIEGIQLILDLATHYSNRIMDVDDILLNALGVILGLIAFDLLKKSGKFYQTVVRLFVFKKY